MITIQVKLQPRTLGNQDIHIHILITLLMPRFVFTATSRHHDTIIVKFIHRNSIGT